MAKTALDSDMVRSLAVLLDENNLTEIEYEAGGVYIRVARNVVPQPVYAPAPAAPMPSAAAPAPAAEDPAEHPGCVKSPTVGVAYLAPEPEAAPFVALGDSVAEGQTLLLIEAMKTFNRIQAPHGGKIAAILVTDGQPVEFGEPLLIVE
jgi:acetyl-CoA carboxylase biotin carboxyl carrier protein